VALEVRKVSKEDYDAYWTPDVCKLLDMHIRETKWWSDEPWREMKWVIDTERKITFYGVSAWHGIEHISQCFGQDVAVVAMDGSVGLLKHKYDGHGKSFSDVYEILLLTGEFEKSLNDFKEMVLKAVDTGGLGLRGKKGLGMELIENQKVIFVDQRKTK